MSKQTNVQIKYLNTSAKIRKMSTAAKKKKKKRVERI